LRLLSLIAATAEICVCDLTDAFEVTGATISHHLRVLREAGLVQVRQDAQRRIYSLRLEPLAEVDEWLGRYRVLWEQRLDALHTEVARGERETRRRDDR
jgi:DNA-binding transcriptional ArsR family regulator